MVECLVYLAGTIKWERHPVRSMCEHKNSYRHNAAMAGYPRPACAEIRPAEFGNFRPLLKTPRDLPSVFMISSRGFPNSAAARSLTASLAKSALSCVNLN